MVSCLPSLVTSTAPCLARLQHLPIAAKVSELVKRVTDGDSAMMDARALEKIKAATAALGKHRKIGFPTGVRYEQGKSWPNSCRDGRQEILAFDEDAA